MMDELSFFGGLVKAIPVGPIMASNSPETALPLTLFKILFDFFTLWKMVDLEESGTTIAISISSHTKETLPSF